MREIRLKVPTVCEIRVKSSCHEGSMAIGWLLRVGLSVEVLGCAIRFIAQCTMLGVRRGPSNLVPCEEVDDGAFPDATLSKNDNVFGRHW
jgi:hypothetical protein